MADIESHARNLEEIAREMEAAGNRRRPGQRPRQHLAPDGRLHACRRSRRPNSLRVH